MHTTHTTVSSEAEFPHAEDEVLDLTLIGGMQEQQTGGRGKVQLQTYKHECCLISLH